MLLLPKNILLYTNRLLFHSWILEIELNAFFAVCVPSHRFPILRPSTPFASTHSRSRLSILGPLAPSRLSIERTTAERSPPVDGPLGYPHAHLFTVRRNSLRLRGVVRLLIRSDQGVLVLLVACWLSHLSHPFLGQRVTD